MVDDFQQAAAHEFFIFDQRDWVDAVVSQSIMKAMVPVGASTEIWEFFTPESPADKSLVPDIARRLEQVQRHMRRGNLCAWERCLLRTRSMGWRLLS